MTPNRVEVVVPQGVSEHRIRQFVHAKQQWVTTTLERLDKTITQAKTFAPEFYSDGAMIPYRGQVYSLTVKQSRFKRIKIEFQEQFIAHLPESLFNLESSDEIRSALIRWMQKEAKPAVEQYVEKYAGRHQLMPRSIKIKTQKSRWGSCGVHNDININWLLMLAPPKVLEYVVVHELCHIKIRNHSALFWHLVAEHMPDYRLQRHWLKENGSGLMLGL